MSYVETWCRDVKETGSFRFKRGENVDFFMEMFPELPKIDEGYKLHLSKCGDTFHEVTTFGDGTTFNTTWKHDVEAPFLGKLFDGANMSLNCRGVIIIMTIHDNL